MAKEKSNIDDCLSDNAGKRQEKDLVVPVEIHDEFYISAIDLPDFLPAYQDFLKLWKK
jgi:hypothetical protein